ncbi:hypothetical protein GCM10022210_12200 [Mucilaginibacter dorajii]|uniref:Uncharacterized protein n=2 Tax=Mucilaginibacter dorajii TaxID=692994 RepID=A0ABP7PH44_9SPHI
MLNKTLPENIPVYLFSPNQSRYFSGSKPSVSLNLHWQTYTPADSVSQWIQSAWFTNTNSIKVIEGNSKPSGTYFTNYIIQSEGDPKSPFTVDINHGNPVVGFKNAKQKLIQIDTTTLKIAIYTDKYNTDAAYLKAALSAVGNFSQRKITTKLYTDSSQIQGGYDWIFWLADKPVDTEPIKKGVHMFSYKTGMAVNTTSWIKTDGPYAIAGQERPIALYKLIKNSSNDNATPLWVDGFGNPVLTKESTSYHFYSHFNPTWNDLVWSDNFPKLLLNLILYNSDNKWIIISNRDTIDHRQLMPNIISSAHNNSSSKVIEQTDLAHYFWLILVVVFLIERWLVHKNKPLVKHG